MRRASSTVLVLLVLALAVPQAAVGAFRDVPSSSVDARPVEVLEKLGVVHGFGDGTFRPWNHVTRAEYLKMLYGSLSRSTEVSILDPDDALPFEDVPADAWYEPFVRSAYHRGIVRGTSETVFSPDRTVTLYEATKMLVAASFPSLGLDATLFPEDDQSRALENAGSWLRDRNLSRHAEMNAPLRRGDVAELLYRWLAVRKTAAARYDAALDAKISIVPIAVPTERAGAIHALREALDLLETNYLESHLLYRGDALEAAIRGVVEGLMDPNSTYSTGEETASFLEHLEGTDVGIGVFLSPQADALLVQRVLPGSPAAAAGIVPGDRILAVDNVVVADDPLGAYGYLTSLSTPGMIVSLELLRADGTRVVVRLPLAKVTLPTVDTELLDGGLLVVRIWEFSAATGREFETAVRTVPREQLRGILLDLRGNPGGLISSAWEVGIQFLPEGSALAILDNPRSESVLTTNVRGPLHGLPTVVLVDSGSASAAEIVAAALRDNLNVPLVGEQTYGKGTVQALLPVGAQGVLRITIARWLTPTGASVHDVGLRPNLDVEFPWGDWGNPDARDPQFDAGEELLRRRMAN